MNKDIINKIWIWKLKEKIFKIVFIRLQPYQ